MPRDLISFEDGAMTVPAEDVPAVATAAHQVVDAAKDAGVWVIGGGLLRQRARIVTPDGTVTDGPYPEPTAVLGGFALIDVPAREAALAWAAKIALACRCAQEVRALMADPEAKSAAPASGPCRSAGLQTTDPRAPRQRNTMWLKQVPSIAWVRMTSSKRLLRKNL